MISNARDSGERLQRFCGVFHWIADPSDDKVVMPVRDFISVASKQGERYGGAMWPQTPKKGDTITLF
jgi:hypothetical protein